MRKTKRPKKSQEKVDLNSLAWSESLVGGDDPFTLLTGGGDEGGFLTLEEIDESDYGFISGAPDSAPLRGPKKRKRGGDGDADSGSEGSCVVEAEEEEKIEEDVKTTTTKKKNNKRRDWKNKNMRKEKEKSGDLRKNDNKNGESAETDVDDDEECPELIPIDTADDIDNDSLLNEDEVYAWKELRLHPLLIKSICKLGFREPTPFHKACILAAAHQGKDVIGAAETGSRKTLAFGLPILQRLLEEREKASRSLQREEKSAKVECGGPLGALVITPTRELALQVQLMRTNFVPLKSLGSTLLDAIWDIEGEEALQLSSGDK